MRIGTICAPILPREAMVRRDIRVDTGYRIRGQARDSILSERRQGKSRQADEHQVRRFHADARGLITCVV